MMTPDLPPYVRYETTMIHPRRAGVRLGVFAAVNTLAKRGALTPDQEAFRRASNDWYDANIPLPTEADPGLYGEAWPEAMAWFKATAHQALARVPGYLEILEAHGVGWEVRAGADPGRILYEDAVQVVTVPWPAAALAGRDQSAS